MALSTLSLLFDISRPSIPAYMKLSSARRRDLGKQVLARLFGPDPAGLLGLSSDGWKVDLPTEVAGGVDTLRIAHGDALRAVRTGLAQLNQRVVGGAAFVLAQEGSGLHAHTASGDSGDDAEDPPPHCIRWVVVDGVLIAVYNWSLLLVEPDPLPGVEDTRTRTSGEILLTDHLGAQDQVLAGMHLALHYPVA